MTAFKVRHRCRCSSDDERGVRHEHDGSRLGGVGAADWGRGVTAVERFVPCESGAPGVGVRVKVGRWMQWRLVAGWTSWCASTWRCGA